MGAFSVLCLFEAGAITAVSESYLYTDTEQTRLDAAPLFSFFFLPRCLGEKRKGMHIM